MLRLQFTAIRHAPAVDDSLFTVPTAPLPGTDPAIYRKYDEIEVGVEALEACVGEYQLAPGVVISITRDGSHLMLQTPGSVKYEIFPFSPTSYYLRFNNLEFHFITDDTGRVTHLALGADRARTAARIVPPS